MWVFINNFEHQTVWRDSLHSEIAWLCGGIRSSRGRHARLVISHVVVPYHSAAHKTLHFVASRLKPDRWFFLKPQNYEQIWIFWRMVKKTPKIPDFIKKGPNMVKNFPKNAKVAKIRQKYQISKKYVNSSNIVLFLYLHSFRWRI